MQIEIIQLSEKNLKIEVSGEYKLHNLENIKLSKRKNTKTLKEHLMSNVED